MQRSPSVPVRLSGPVRVTLAVAVCLAFIVPSLARAQAVTGTLLGNITDSSGAAVPGATVTATRDRNQHQPIDRRPTKPASTFSRACRTARYNVDAELQGFKKAVRAERQGRRQHDHSRRPDAGGRPARPKRSRSRPRRRCCRPTAPTPGGIIESKMVTDMPLTFNRNFQSILITVPGSTRPHREHSQFFNSQDSLAVEVNGQPRHGEQHADRRARQQPQDRPAAGHHPGGRRARDRQRVDEQLRRGVRPIGRRRHERDAEVRHQRPARAAASSSATPTRPSPAIYFTGVKAPTKFAQRRLHARRPDCPQQAVLLRRLSAHDRQRRLRRPHHRADPGDAERRLQRRSRSGIYDPSTGAVNGTGRVPFANNRSRRIASARSRGSCWRSSRCPILPARCSGRTTTMKAQTREKTTDGFDVEDQSHAQRAGPDLVSRRASCGRSCSIRVSTASTAGRPTAGSRAPARTRAPARRSRGRAYSARRRSSTCAAG